MANWNQLLNVHTMVSLLHLPSPACPSAHWLLPTSSSPSPSSSSSCHLRPFWNYREKYGKGGHSLMTGPVVAEFTFSGLEILAGNYRQLCRLWGSSPAGHATCPSIDISAVYALTCSLDTHLNLAPSPPWSLLLLGFLMLSSHTLSRAPQDDSFGDKLNSWSPEFTAYGQSSEGNWVCSQASLSRIKLSRLCPDAPLPQGEVWDHWTAVTKVFFNNWALLIPLHSPCGNEVRWLEKYVLSYFFWKFASGISCWGFMDTEYLCIILTFILSSCVI